MTLRERRKEAAYYQIPRWREVIVSIATTPIFFIPHLAFPRLCILWNIKNWIDKLFFGYIFIIFSIFVILVLFLIGVAIETWIRKLINKYDDGDIIYSIFFMIEGFIRSTYMMMVAPYPKKWYFLKVLFKPSKIAKELLDEN